MSTTCTHKGTKNARSQTFSWNLTGTSAEVGLGTPQIGHYRDRCIQAYGTFNSAVITIEGSNDPRAEPGHASYASAIWAAVTDPGGTPITFSAAGMKQILESPLYMRASINDAGDANTNLNVVLHVAGGEH